jgi:class 3 adenylate cyclase
VYTSLGFYDKALENFGNALAVLEEIGAKLDIANVTGSIGSAYQSQGSYDSALEYFLRALAVYEELDAKYGVASATGNIGNVYWFLGDYDNALKYYEKNLAAASEIRAKLGVAVGIGNIGCVYTVKDYEGYDAVKGEEYLLKALALSGEINAKEKIAYWHEYLACLYENEKRWEDFAFHYKKYHETEKEVQSESAKKQANLMEQQRQTAEREKALAAERAEARATQNVLHQVLPPSIADRLVKGEKVADYFQNVSILFADIVGFTPIASRMPAKVVLAFLNHVFGAFDDIIEKHGCEKIKTIGDGYLAVAGAPIPCADHAERIARAALDMLEDIHLPEDIRRHLPNGLQFSIRIGIHTGPAFGGIIGAKRFVYDIYSDAVNIAARMESHGEPGKIHCSDDFAHHLQNRDEAFVFKEREEMDIKGKGKMRTYFLEKNI